MYLMKKKFCLSLQEYRNAYYNHHHNHRVFVHGHQQTQKKSAQRKKNRPKYDVDVNFCMVGCTDS